jgi:rubredoxin
MKTCSICGSAFAEAEPDSVYLEAGGWLSDEFWRDKGELCPQCLENRAKLAMMYVVDR